MDNLNIFTIQIVADEHLARFRHKLYSLL